MTRGIVLASLALSGCLGGPTGELWLFQFGSLDGECVDVIDENYIEAKVSEEAPPDENWTYTDDSQLSDRLVLGTILRGKRGVRTLILDGVLYPGVEEKGVTTFEWESSTDSQSTQSHDAGYAYTEALLNLGMAKLVMERDQESKEQAGKIDWSAKIEQGWSEDDEWAFEAVGLNSGQIPAFRYLDGPGVANDPARDDCTGAACTLTVATECTSSGTFQATYLGKTENSGYDGLEDAEMSYGALGLPQAPSTY